VGPAGLALKEHIFYNKGMIPSIKPKEERTGMLTIAGKPIPPGHPDGLGHLVVDPCSQAGQWMLIVGPSSIRPILMRMIAGLAEQAPVRVLDGGYYLKREGSQFGEFELAHLLHGKPQALARVAMARASSCQQMLTLLKNTPSRPKPFVVLGLLNPFYDLSVKYEERKRLLKGCLEHLDRLAKAAGGAVSVSPPRARYWSRMSANLFKMVEEAANDSGRVRIMLPSQDLKRFY
jgi:hypothetical protein